LRSFKKHSDIKSKKIAKKSHTHLQKMYYLCKLKAGAVDGSLFFVSNTLLFEPTNKHQQTTRKKEQTELLY